MTKRKSEHPLTKLAEAAFREASKKVIERARQTNTPVIVEEKGIIVRLWVVDGELVKEEDLEKEGGGK